MQVQDDADADAEDDDDEKGVADVPKAPIKKTIVVSSLLFFFLLSSCLCTRVPYVRFSVCII